MSLSVLIHPASWTDLDSLARGDRVTLALGLLAATLLPAIVSGLLLWRWAKRRRVGPQLSRAAQLSWRLVLLFLLLGLYGSVRVAPLKAAVEHVLSSFLFVAAALVAARLVSGTIALVLSLSVAHVHNGERERIDREYVPLGSKIATLGIGIVFLITVLKHFDTDVSSLIAALGIGTLAIGLAAQQTLGNMLAGFTLLVDRPFRPGDRIRLASSEVGQVVAIGMRSTRIELPDTSLLIVPNTELVNSRVVNVKVPVRIEVRAVVAKAADAERALAIIEAIARERQLVNPQARLVGLASFGIELSLQANAGAVDAAALEAEVRRAVLAGLLSAQIEVGGRPISR